MYGRAARADADRLRAILCLRGIVGYLGEKTRFDWWPSGFFTASSPAFLNPVFARTLPLAQYHGVKEAARRVHDDHIGVGRVFHLFRLPETLEQSLFEVLQDPAVANLTHRAIDSQATALEALQSFFKPPASVREGPVQVGTAADLEGDAWLGAVARCYHAAFMNGVRSYPYLVDRA